MAEYIERETLLEAMGEVYDCYNPDIERDRNIRKGIVFVKWVVESHPTADVAEVKHGKWKKIQNYALCTNCKHKVNWGCKDFLSPYCPECGAKMDKE